MQPSAENFQYMDRETPWQTPPLRAPGLKSLANFYGEDIHVYMLSRLWDKIFRKS